jgi:plasmid stability protein
MASLTVRNIPEQLLEGLRVLSERERRSLNNEVLVVLEEGLASKAERLEAAPLGSGLQADLWLDLCGLWQDERSADEIIEDIHAHRTLGREVDL